jgi:transcriptional regulator with XRE-family HTH domain
MKRAGIAARFGQNLRQARRAAGLSQEEVGIGASLHRTEIGLLERGERIPRIDTAIKLAGAVGVSVPELVDGIAWEPGHASPGGFEVSASSEHEISPCPPTCW